MSNHCEVCGIKVPPAASTCSTECGKAKRAGITREEQLRRDCEAMPWGDPYNADDVGMIQKRRYRASKDAPIQRERTSGYVDLT